MDIRTNLNRGNAVHDAGKTMQGIPQQMRELLLKFYGEFCTKPNIMSTGQLPLQAALDEVNRISKRISEEFHDFLVSTGYAPGKPDEIAGMDMIDAVALYKGIEYINDGVQDPLVRMPFPHQLGGDPEIGYMGMGPAMNLLPCYEKGVLQINKRRYIVWKIMKLELGDDEIMASIRLWNYVRTGGEWRPICMVNTVLSDFLEDKKMSQAVRAMGELLGAGDSSNNSLLADDDCFVKTYEFMDQFDFVEYVCANEKSVTARYGWGSEEWFIMDKLMTFQAMEQRKPYGEEGKLLRDITVSLFYDTIGCINKSLRDGLVARKAKASASGNDSRRVETRINKDARQPGKTVRSMTVGTGEVKFSSDKPPRAATEKLVRTYSVVQWKRKATIRKYKSGKTAYIRETVCHRKGFEAVDGKVPQSVIKVNNPDLKKSGLV